MRFFLKFITATVVSVISLLAITFVVCNLKPVDLHDKAESLKSYCHEHGSGGKSTILRPDFSNTHGSHCSSLGHYRIGRRRHMYNRPFVPAVELHGLDKTNNCLNSLTLFLKM